MKGSGRIAKRGKNKRVSGITGMVGIFALIGGVLWVYYSAGATNAILTPLGILLVVGAALAISGHTRRVSREHQALSKHPRNPYAMRREAISKATRSVAKRETWPYDGSYCPRCGLMLKEEEVHCRRCGEKL